MLQHVPHRVTVLRAAVNNRRRTRSESRRRGPRIPDLGRTAVKTNQSDSHRVSAGGLNPCHFVICRRIDEILMRRRRGVQVSRIRDQGYGEG